MNGMEKIVNRSADFVGSYGYTRMHPDRVDVFAKAKVEIAVAKQQMELFAYWCYQQHNNHWLHITASGQIPTGTWVPWGSSGKSRTTEGVPELTKPIRAVLRSWLIQQSRNRRFPPWFYDPDERRWYVDLRRYDSLEEALIWLKNNPVLPDGWIEMRRSKSR